MHCWIVAIEEGRAESTGLRAWHTVGAERLLPATFPRHTTAPHPSVMVDG